jgi:hypothetical protein
MPSKSQNSSELVPLLLDDTAAASSPPPATVSTKKLSMNNSKVAPIISKATLINKTNTAQSASITPSTSGFHFKPYTIASAGSKSNSTSANASKAGKDDKKKDVKKNESVEKKKAEKAAKAKAKKEKASAEFFSSKFYTLLKAPQFSHSIIIRRRSDWQRKQRKPD